VIHRPDRSASATRFVDWGAARIVSVPVATAYDLFLDRVTGGITAGAVT